LLVYDAMRQLSMVVEGTTIDDFRWSGIPRIPRPQRQPRPRRAPPGAQPRAGRCRASTTCPGVTPTSIRSDHGSIFVGEHFRALMNQFGIELRLSRGKKPTDNPHSERKMEDLERAYQQSPGHPDLIYQFLPIIWLAPGHAGVEFKNLTYDDEVLEDFRDVRKSEPSGSRTARSRSTTTRAT
jgi:hypothetical protein